MKATGSFKMSADTKRMLALETNSHKRGDVKRLMVQAELAAAIKPKVRENNAQNNTQNSAPRETTSTSSTS